MPNGVGARGEGGEKRGEEIASGDQLMPLIKLEGRRGGRANSQTCPVSNCIHDMSSFPLDLSFSYLRSAVEASMELKKYLRIAAVQCDSENKNSSSG